MLLLVCVHGLHHPVEAGHEAGKPPGVPGGAPRGARRRRRVQLRRNLTGPERLPVPAEQLGDHLLPAPPLTAHPVHQLRLRVAALPQRQRAPGASGDVRAQGPIPGQADVLLPVPPLLDIPGGHRVPVQQPRQLVPGPLGQPAADQGGGTGQPQAQHPGAAGDAGEHVLDGDDGRGDGGGVVHATHPGRCVGADPRSSTGPSSRTVQAGPRRERRRGGSCGALVRAAGRRPGAASSG
ncbi:Uncharacterised protein [Mycobacteroides abscessus subsp. abscessus]|nr:Uncharacterised protein [Mycobacteroides abscessus subsp. abscessus]